LARTIIDKEVCKGCALCVRECPVKIIAISDKSNASGYFYVCVTDGDKCIGCANCAVVCPDCAIEVQR
jgi:2-oxoglutarate ferredoxin oxidoreductase subunit delta